MRTLADSATGYMLNIQPYFGRSDEEEIPEELTKTAMNIVKLMEPYLDMSYHVFCDSLYTSVGLTDKLYEQRDIFHRHCHAKQAGPAKTAEGKAEEGRHMRVPQWPHHGSVLEGQEGGLHAQ